MVIILKLLGLASAHWKVTAVAAAVLFGVGLYSCQIRKAEKRGAADAVQKIERANEAAKDKATEAERRAIACHNAGRKWNREKQTCE